MDYSLRQKKRGSQLATLALSFRSERDLNAYAGLGLLVAAHLYLVLPPVTMLLGPVCINLAGGHPGERSRHQHGG